MKQSFIAAIFLIFSWFYYPVIAGAEGLPDVYVENMTYTDKVTFIMGNKGTGDASSGVSLRYQFLDSAGKSVGSAFNMGYQGMYFSPGGSLALVNKPLAENPTATNLMYIYNPPAGASLLRVILDPDNKIIESDETNNQTSAAIPLPDLTFGKATYNLEKLEAEVKNIGQKTAEKVVVQITWVDDQENVKGIYVGEASTVPDVNAVNTAELGSIAAGESKTIIREAKFNFALYKVPYGATKLRLKIMSSGAEVSKDNNEKFVPKLTLPDLSFGIVTYTEDKLVAEVKNNGTAPVFGSNTAFLGTWLDEEGNELPIPPDTPAFGVGNIAAGSAVTITYEKSKYSNLIAFLAPPPEAVKLRLKLDWANGVEEYSETNNIKDLNLTYPDIAFGSVSYTPEKLEFEVKNNGNITAKDILIKMFWVDDENTLVGLLSNGAPDPNVFQGAWIDVMAAGNSKTFIREASAYPQLYNPPPGGTKLKLEIISDDPPDFATSNNQMYLQEIKMPDLVFTAAAYTDDTLAVEFKNIGKSAANLGGDKVIIIFGAWLDANDNEIEIPETVTAFATVKNLSVGASFNNTYEKSFDATTFPFISAPAGAVKLRLKLDWNNQVAEFNEKNNTTDVIKLGLDDTGEELAEEDEDSVVEEVAEDVVRVKESEDKGAVEKEKDPRILPGNILYPFKSAFREIKSFFTRDKEKKTELRLQYANQKMLEINKLTDKGETKKAKEHLKKYEKDIERLDDLISNLTARDERAAEKLKEKTLKSELKHQFIIGKLERKAEDDDKPAISETRNKATEHLAKDVGALKDQSRVEKALREALSDEGTLLRPMRNLEVLKAVEEKVPESANKDAIRRAKENSLIRLIRQVEVLSEERQTLLPSYIKRGGGNDARYLDALEEARLYEVGTSARSILDKAEDEVFSLVRARAERAKDIETLKLIEERRLRAQKTREQRTVERSSSSAAATTTPRSTTTEDRVQSAECSNEYEPVCGSDRRTYTNSCYARRAGISVQYEGVCRDEGGNNGSAPTR